MSKVIQAISLVALFCVGGCDHEQRIKALEKENQELKETAKRANASADYDTATKCSRDAKAWVRENFPPDKDTLTLTYTNHFNRSKNRCFVLVEWHYRLGRGESWTNHMSLWDINENAQYGDFSQSHIVLQGPEYHVEDQPVHCHTNPKNCSSEDDFSNFARTYLND